MKLFSNVPSKQPKKVVNNIWEIGEYFQKGMNQMVRNHGLDDLIKCIGYPCRSILSFEGKKDFNNLELKTYFIQEFAKHQILWTGFNGLNYSTQGWFAISDNCSLQNILYALNWQKKFIKKKFIKYS